jgi:hypothetical protein
MNFVHKREFSGLGNVPLPACLKRYASKESASQKTFPYPTKFFLGKISWPSEDILMESSAILR